MHRFRFDVLCRALCVVAFLWSATSTGQAEEMISIVTGPPSNRVDMVFLGDGYQEHELPLYETHIGSMVEYMFTQEPFDRYENFFNQHRINVVSNESGADVPPDDIDVDTALGATYYFDGETERLLYIDALSADQALLRSIPITNIFAPDMQFVSVNSDRRGGAGGTFAVFSGANFEAYEIAVHEIAHSFTNLTDEYFFAGTNYSGPEPFFANATISPEGEKWAHWVGYEQPGIGTIGAYEGGMFHEQGIYRPSDNSKMRTLGRPFDAVSREALVLEIYERVDPIDSFTGSEQISELQMITVETIDPEVIDLTWFIDGELLEGITGETLELQTLSELGYEDGSYDISVVAQDNTDWVRIRRDELRQELLWEDIQLVASETPAIGIDELTDAVRLQSDDIAFDLNGDGIVSELDREFWVDTNQTYFGDANLDGAVDFSDFLVLSRNFGSTDANWEDGNFNVDRTVDFGDFLFLSRNFGEVRTSDDGGSGEAPFSVPEPTSLHCLLSAVLMGALFRRKRVR